MLERSLDDPDERPAGEWQPTRHAILTLKQRLESRYQSRNARIQEWRALLKDEVKIEIPDAYVTATQHIKLGLPRQWVRRTVGVLTSEPMVVRCPPPPDPTDDDLRNATSKGRWITALLKQMERQQVQRLRHDLAHYVCVDGQGWLKLVYKPDAWKGMPELSEYEELTPAVQKEYKRRMNTWKRSAPAPFAIRTPDPATVYPVWGSFGLDAVVEMSRLPWAQAMHSLGPLGAEPLSAWDLDADEEVQILEYWDKKWQKILVAVRGAWMEAKAFKHNYGFIPYFHAPGWSEPHSEPSERNLSILVPLEGQISWMYTMLTAKGFRSWMESYTTWQFFGIPDPESGDGASKPFKLSVGMVHPVDPGSEGYKALEGGQHGRDFEEMFAVLAAASESSQIDESATGGGAFSGESGYFRSLRAMQARVPFDQLGEGLANAWQGCFARILECVDRILGDAVTVRYGDKASTDWLTLGPEQIDGLYDVDVLVDTRDPMSQVAIETHYNNMRKDGFVPHRLALLKSGYESPEEVMDESLWEQFMASGPMLGWVFERMMAGMGRPLRPQPGPQEILGPNGQPMSHSQAGQMGGAPGGMPRLPSVGMPTQGPANQPNPITVRR